MILSANILRFAMAGMGFLLAGAFMPAGMAAVFTGAGRIAVADSTGGLSWNDATSALTVSCWFKFSIPSDVSITGNMVIMANRSSGTWNNGQMGQISETHAYAIYYNAATGAVEFSTRGSGGLFSRALIERPSLERWYHVAVTRSGGLVNGYVDGRRIFNAGLSAGNAQSTDGLSIGGLGTGNYFRGEIIEAQVFQSALSQNRIAGNRFQDLNPASWTSLRGYYKLAFNTVTANQLKNTATAPPTGSDPAQIAGGGITFEETNREGEQSLFDSRKNDGQDASSALAGPFTWQQSVLSRPTAGIPFEFSISYSSANAYQQTPFEEGFDPFAPSALGHGWRHTFETRVLPNSAFNPASESGAIGLMLWDGSIETWDFLDTVPGTGMARFKTRHKEYRGDLHFVGNSFDPAAEVRWITPDRLIYVFRSPFVVGGDSAMLGRLKEIRDFNGNRLVVEHHEAGERAGLVSRVLDTGGGVWIFEYDAQNLLTSVNGPGPDAAVKWASNFTYTTSAGKNVLFRKSIVAPAAYATVPSTVWEFRYDPEGRMHRVVSPRYAGTNKFHQEVTFDAFGRKSSEWDAGERETRYEYNKPAVRQLTTIEPYPAVPAEERRTISTFDRKMRLLAHRDEEGFDTSIGYDEAGNVIQTTDARGQISRMTYDERSNLLTQTNALGETTAWAYGHVLADGTKSNEPTREIRPATTEAPAGWESLYEYDAAGNLRFHRDGPVGGPLFGTLVEHAYDARGLAVSSRDANGNESRFAYDPVTGFQAGRTIAFGTPEAATWSVTRNELGWPLAETNPLNETTGSAYNVNGQVVQVTDPIGRQFTKLYDSNGNLLSETDGKGRETAYAYTLGGELGQKTDRLGQAWNYEFNRFGEVWQILAPAAVSDGATERNVVTQAYDRKGRLIRVTDPYGKSIAYEYDANDNRTATVDKLGRRWIKDHDALNRVFAERDPEGNVRRTAYDAAGRVLEIQSPNGHPSFHEYDGRSRLKRWTDPEGFVWIYSYDGVGNILDIEDALGGHYVMTYGPRNERLTERNQDGKEWAYGYDPMVRLKTQANPPGAGAGPGGGPVARTLFYDAAGRIDYVEFNTGRINDLAYDLNNNVVTVTRTRPGQPVTSLTLTYDELDRLIESRDTFSQTVGYGYDPLGRVVTKSYPGGRVLTHQYDRLNRLTRLSFPKSGGSHDCTFAYDDADRLIGRSYPNGVTQTNVFDSAGRLASLGHAGSAAPPIALGYAYDRNGNKTAGTENGTLDWKRGALADYDESATYKPDGKIETRTDIFSPRDFTYQHDAAGNLTTASAPGESYSLAYDEDNRTTAITWDVGLTSKVITNRYDALGRRIARTLDGVETRYILDLTGGMERILCDTDAAGSILAWYVHGPDLCFRVAADGGLTCYHADAMGNIIRTTDAAGGTRNQYAYTPYGRTIPVAGSIPDGSDPYRFVGSQGVMLELPNLYFMRARYYSAETAVFFAVDPIYNIGSSWVPSAFLYADNNPYQQIDADGNCPGLANFHYYENYGGGGFTGGKCQSASDVEDWIQKTQGIDPVDDEDHSYYFHDLYSVAIQNEPYLVRAIGQLYYDAKLGRELNTLAKQSATDGRPATAIRQKATADAFYFGGATIVNQGNIAANSVKKNNKTSGLKDKNESTNKVNPYEQAKTFLADNKNGVPKIGGVVGAGNYANFLNKNTSTRPKSTAKTDNKQISTPKTGNGIIKKIGSTAKVVKNSIVKLINKVSQLFKKKK